MDEIGRPLAPECFELAAQPGQTLGIGTLQLGEEGQPELGNPGRRTGEFGDGRARKALGTADEGKLEAPLVQARPEQPQVGREAAEGGGHRFAPKGDVHERYGLSDAKGCPA